MTAVRVEGLRVSYGARPALDGVSFAVAPGEIVGLLGPNGAGKTTTLSVLATLRRPDAGDAEVAGHRRRAGIRRACAVCSASCPSRWPSTRRSPRARTCSSLRACSGSAVVPRREATGEALRTVGLAERADDVVATFSGGMQRRLNLACALLHRPRVLLLDEPTVGVDPQSRERIFDAVRAQAAAGAAVLYSTHLHGGGRAALRSRRAHRRRPRRRRRARRPSSCDSDGGIRLVLVTRTPLAGRLARRRARARACSRAPPVVRTRVWHRYELDDRPGDCVLERAAFSSVPATCSSFTSAPAEPAGRLLRADRDARCATDARVFCRLLAQGSPPALARPGGADLPRPWRR